MENENQAQGEQNPKPAPESAPAPTTAPVPAPKPSEAGNAGVDKLMVIATYVLFFIPLIVERLKNNEFYRFHARQSLGLLLSSVAAGIIANIAMPVGSVLQFALLVLWIMSLVSALHGKQEATPIIGEYFKKINI